MPRATRRTNRLLQLAAVLLRGPAAVIVAVLGAFVLGYWGFRSIPGTDFSGGDAMYRTLQLFNTDAQVPGTDTPWQIEIARFLAPATVAYAALVAVFALAREEVQKLRTRWFARNHVLIIGLGVRGARLARSLREKYGVVVIEKDSSNGAARGMRATGVPVIVGDGRDPAMLNAGRAQRAAHVVVLTSDDTVNLSVGAALAHLAGPANGTFHHIAIESPVLWSELHRVPLQTTRTAPRVEFFSVPDRVARTLVEAAADWGANRPAVRPPSCVLIRGEGPTAARLVIHLLRTYRSIRRVDIAADSPLVVRSVLNQSDPWVFDRCAIEMQERRADPDLAFVCGAPEGTALASSVELARGLVGQAPIFVAVDNPEISTALSGTGINVDRVVLVPTRSSILGEQLIRGSAIETLARAKHADYVAHQISRGETLDDNPSLVSWDELPKSLRSSNRSYAVGVAAKLGKLGAELRPLTGDPADMRRLNVPEETLEELAHDEHDRWAADLKAEGWQYTDGPKDPTRKLHPMLVEWERLSGAEREKDRDGVRELPALLARVGYELSLPTERAEIPR